MIAPCPLLWVDVSACDGGDGEMSQVSTLSQLLPKLMLQMPSFTRGSKALRVLTLFDGPAWKAEKARDCCLTL